MPKIVDHEARREQIAHVACQVIATHGFEQATVVRIARAAGYTTGMVAHYFESKQEIVFAALRLILLRIEQRLTKPTRGGKITLLSVLSESLALDRQRFVECAFWTAFWGQLAADQKFRRINAAVHQEYLRLYERCFCQYWPEWAGWSPRVRRQVLRSAVTTINGLTASAVTSPAEWPASVQVEQLKLQLQLLKGWAQAA